MADSVTPSSEPDTKPAKTPDDQAARYWREVDRYDRASEGWRTMGDKIVDLYTEERAGTTEVKTKHFPLLYANVETLKPAVYAKMPIVQASRRFKDRDPVGRIAAEILERCANTTFDLYNLDEVMRMVRDDRLLPGRGQAWVRYEADVEGDKVESEKVCVDYVHWHDFGHNVARTWADVRLVWRRVFKTRAEAKERFGALADKLVYNSKFADEKDESGYRACIYELWDKTRGAVAWLSKEHEGFLEEGAPPLDFHGFFPCPEPCYASKTSKSLIPTADYVYYRSQAKEIDDLTAKIDNLTRWLILKGFVPLGASSEGGDAIERLVRDLVKNEEVLVGVENWAAFTEKGGAAKLVDWLPLQHVVVALKGAVELRKELIQDVYQITGISDVLRAQTDPNETLGAQQIKSQTGDRRLRNTRDEIVRFARDIARLVCEVIAEQFQPATLAAMSGFKYVSAQAGVALPAPEPMGAPDGLRGLAPGAPPMEPMPGQPPGMPVPPGGQMPPMAQPTGPAPMQGGAAAPNTDRPEEAGVFDDRVVRLLRDERVRNFRIDIETDSTIQPDEDAEKQRRTEFLTAVGSFLKQSQEILAAAPQLAPMAGELLLFTARGFRAGRMLEDTIERATSQFSQQAQAAAQQPREDPKTVEAKANMQIELERARMQAQAEQQKTAAALAAEKTKADAANDIAREKAATDIEIARMKAQADIEIARMKAECDTEIKQKAATQDQANRAESFIADGAAKQAKGAEKSNGAAVKLNLGENVGNTIAETVKEALASVGDVLADKLSNVTLKVQAPPRIRIPKYDKQGNIVSTRETDEEPTGMVQ